MGCHCRDARQAAWLSALVSIVGGLLLAMVIWARINQEVMSVGDSIMEKIKYVSLPNHVASTGYQHTVRLAPQHDAPNCMQRPAVHSDGASGSSAWQQ